MISRNWCLTILYINYIPGKLGNHRSSIYILKQLNYTLWNIWFIPGVVRRILGTRGPHRVNLVRDFYPVEILKSYSTKYKGSPAIFLILSHPFWSEGLFSKYIFTHHLSGHDSCPTTWFCRYRNTGGSEVGCSRASQKWRTVFDTKDCRTKSQLCQWRHNPFPATCSDQIPMAIALRA